MLYTLRLEPQSQHEGMNSVIAEWSIENSIGYMKKGRLAKKPHLGMYRQPAPAQSQKESPVAIWRLRRRHGEACATRSTNLGGCPSHLNP